MLKKPTIAPNMKLEDLQKRFNDEVQYVDTVSQVLLKGHLLIEEVLTQTLELNVLHSKFIGKSKLTFNQKLHLCRAISLSDQDNRMWSLISAINSVRNQLSHTLNSEKRQPKMDALRQSYLHNFSDLPNIEKHRKDDDTSICIYAVGGCLGYLTTFHSEVKRLKGLILGLDLIMNKGKLS